MTKLELVKHTVFIDQVTGKSMRGIVVAVSTSYSALERFCKKEYNADIKEIGCGEQEYFTIQDTNIEIIAFDYE